ncbi:MAG: hypothetical protein HWE08_04190 [Alphaproteobacteria bacterium]|nr:hypothetical protein [Alphaproteobacteria bacterium]
MDDLLEQNVNSKGKPSNAQRRYLERGLDQPGGKLPLFDGDGQRIKDQTIKSCLSKGWCEPWYRNPIKPDWLVCKLTAEGRSVLSREKL